MAKTATRGDAGARDLASSHRAVGEGAPRIDAVANVTGASRFGLIARSRAGRTALVAG